MRLLPLPELNLVEKHPPSTRLLPFILWRHNVIAFTLIHLFDYTIPYMVERNTSDCKKAFEVLRNSWCTWIRPSWSIDHHQGPAWGCSKVMSREASHMTHLTFAFGRSSLFRALWAVIKWRCFYSRSWSGKRRRLLDSDCLTCLNGGGWVKKFLIWINVVWRFGWSTSFRLRSNVVCWRRIW